MSSALCRGPRGQRQGTQPSEERHRQVVESQSLQSPRLPRSLRQPPGKDRRTGDASLAEGAHFWKEQVVVMVMWCGECNDSITRM